MFKSFKLDHIVMIQPNTEQLLKQVMHCFHYISTFHCQRVLYFTDLEFANEFIGFCWSGTSALPLYNYYVSHIFLHESITASE